MLSCVQLFVTLMDCTLPKAPLSMEFSRQEYWSEFHFLLQGIFLTQGSNPSFLHCRQILYQLSLTLIMSAKSPLPWKLTKGLGHRHILSY